MPNSRLKNACKMLVNSFVPIMPKGVRQQVKHAAEMAFWKGKHSKSGGVLANAHYRFFYTSFFNIDPEEYSQRCILDIGCGPRGSLEWADMARERVGLDPLADDYRKFGIDKHRMNYVCAPSEQIPFPEGHFDFVTCFNALDHVDDVEKTLSEIARVLKGGGSFLLITEINHHPTVTEPQTLSAELLEHLEQSFVSSNVRFCAIRGDHDVYGSLREGLPYDKDDRTHPGLLTARLIRKPATG